MSDGLFRYGSCIKCDSGYIPNSCYFINYDDKSDKSYGSGSEGLDAYERALEMIVESVDLNGTDDGDLHLSADVENTDNSNLEFEDMVIGGLEVMEVVVEINGSRICKNMNRACALLVDKGFRLAWNGLLTELIFLLKCQREQKKYDHVSSINIHFASFGNHHEFLSRLTICRICILPIW
ncbi:hypothetical protein RF11_00901 [Thelohanellus kitauei]|uniref:Uncharacterized protein n=1 Tax=Thelohanellus kitauei TaxID=669202 RepID=A0A0C2MMH1_THEKT|nr:hypothetical protein RF11_00901 [Thelohanellus kitauei]